MASTKTEHLTSLSFNLTDMKAQLDSIPASVQEAALKAQEAWNKNFSMDGAGVSGDTAGTGGGSGADKVTKMASVTKAQLDSLMLSYKNFETVLSRTSTNPETITRLRNEVKEAQAEIERLMGSLNKSGKITGENARSYHTLTSGIKRAKGEVADLKTHVNDTAGAFDRTGKSIEETGTGIKNFLGKLSDKARWLGAFYLIQGIINGFKALISTVKETEQTVVELQRVLNDDVSSPEISSQLYDIAYEYGRTFEEVQESAVLFAQTGKSWNDVLTLTRGTMLALNTAELDVTQATQGLIAVMAQWNLGAEDYVGLIDKINITADNYAITSEAIVEAMKRSSSTAKTYGLSLEELIGVITALGEATGRSGENLGTAINSLIIYTTRAKSIDVLKKMGVDAEDAEGNLLPILDIWSQLAQKIKGGDLAFAEFMAQDQESISQFLADSEEYKAAVDETILKGKEVQDAYSIAGTYRRNYFISLLSNLTTAEEAVAGMTDAEGRSVAENQKYMATLTAISNQLKTSWQQLAVALGDAGFLEALKWVAELGIGLAKLIGNTGGLKNALSFVLGILIMIKAQKIQEFFTGIGASVKALTTGVNAAGEAVSGLQLAFGWIGLAITAISLLVGGLKALNAAMDDSRRKTLDAGAAAREATDSLGELIQKYKELASTSEYAAGSESALASARSIHEDIVKLLGDQEVGWDLVNGKIDENIQKLRDAQLQKIINERENLRSAYIVAQKQLETFKDFTFGEAAAINRAFTYIGDAQSEMLGANFLLAQAFWEDGADGAIELLKNWQEEFNSLGTDGADAISAITSMITVYTDKVETAAQARKNWLGKEAMGEVLERSKSVTIDSIDAYDAYVKTVDDAAASEKITAEYAGYLKDAIASIYPEFVNVVDASDKLQESLGDLTLDDTLNTAELAAAAFKETQDQVNEFTSSMDALNSVVSKYNETGIMTTEMLNSLLGLSSEYLALLDVTAGGLSVNKDATDDLIDSKQDLIKAMIDEKFYMEAAAIASEYAAAADKDKWAADVLAASGSRELGGSMWEIVSSAASAATSVEGATNSIYNALIGMGYASGQAQALANKLGTVAFAYRNVSAAASGLSLGSFGGATATAPKASGGGGGGGGGGGEDPQIKILEARKKAIEETAQAQIDALKEVQEAEDRKRRRDEYLADKSEALADVRRAQSRSGIEAREDEADAEKKLADVNKDWQEQLQDWNLDDQIKAIEEWKEAMVEAIDAQLDALKNAGGGGGGGSVSDAFAKEADVLTQNKDVLLAALLEMDNENLHEKIKAFYQLFDASQYTSDVDFADQLAGIKTDWDTFASENGDDWAIHYKMVLDDGTTMTPEQINDYINGLLGKATSESDLLQLDKEGLGILLRVTPSAETDQETEDQWSQTVTDLGEALDKMLSLWEFDNLDTDSARQAIEDAFNEAFDAAEQAATDSGVVIGQQMTQAADDTGAAMLTSVNGYSPQIVDAWNNNLVNPMIDSLGDLSDSLNGILSQLGQVAAFGGINLGGTGLYGNTSNTSNTQNNFVNLNGRGSNQVNAFSGWMAQLK